MSTRSNARPFPVIINGDMSLASIISKPTVLQSLTIASYSYSWAGSGISGTISIQVSNDYSINADGTVNNAGTWVAVPIASGGTTANSVVLTGNSGEGFIEGGSGAYAVRTVYTRVSGTGSLQAIFVGKVS